MLINFLIVAACVFAIIKAFNKMKDGGVAILKRNEDGEEVEEILPKCPYCLEEVNVGATRCFHCGAELPEEAKPTIEKADA
ncbi:MAG: hypothetical protein HUK15_06185 [Bacteroidales bacterium]|nr:hypothetical protein [Bacteroidales bacterium]